MIVQNLKQPVYLRAPLNQFPAALGNPGLGQLCAVAGVRTVQQPFSTPSSCFSFSKVRNVGFLVG